MGDNADRELILRQIWYSEDGFGSQKKLYDDAKKLIPNITHNEVKTWLGKQKMVQTRGFKTFNSYIADGPLEEVAFDLAVFTKSAKINDGFQYAMVAVDVFSKFCHVVKMKNISKFNLSMTDLLGNKVSLQESQRNLPTIVELIFKRVNDDYNY